MDCLPIPFVCFQCGTDQNPCHCKVVGPTIGFASAIVLAVWTMFSSSTFFNSDQNSGCVLARFSLLRLLCN
ncbi:hypothetical protein D6C88_05185 [Aureobasidium pullulans]|nr:hypothetical protein D6C88_05185 [Aureobasidium pullulans]